ncbi:hypothetical protein TrVE_jg11791 [Triparma verrucosa]|uniref:Uncharacterized protein n=1 Tax=Triparma verrucosa TaxID=1606542 RepID=A0A9W7CDE3_9STRA|nr:hypothetical protein TrVE_jg11791 [Triparma verrucosa]
MTVTAKLDMMTGKEKGSYLQKVRPKRNGHSWCGVLLTVAIVVSAVLYCIYLILESSWTYSTQTSIQMLNRESSTFSVKCMASMGCFVTYQLSGEFVETMNDDGTADCFSFTQSSSWSILSTDINEERLVTDYVANVEAGAECFKSTCVFLEQYDEITIDNFTPITNPITGGLHLQWDAADGTFGAALAPSYTVSGTPVKLFDGAHFFTRIKTTDHTNFGPGDAMYWVNEVFTAGVFEDTPVEECPAIPEGWSGARFRAEFYMKASGVQRDITYTNPILSILGEIGGFLELLVAVGLQIMVLYWISFRRIKKLPPTNEEEEEGEDEKGGHNFVEREVAMVRTQAAL